MMKLVIFDFDGVLAHTHLICYEIHRELNPDLDYKLFQSLSRGNFLSLYQQAVKDKKIIDNPNFLKVYREKISSLDMPPRLKSMLFELAEKWSLFVVSSTNSGYINPYLEKEGVADKFIKVLGSETHASKTEKINMLLGEYSVEPHHALYVTDTTGDIAEAREAGVESIAVSWGLHEPEELLAQSPLFVVNTPEELKEKINHYFAFN